MNKNKIIFVCLSILMIIYSTYTYPVNIEKNHQGLIISKFNKNFKKTIHIKIKGKLHRKLFYKRNQFKGIIEIDNKVYDLDLFSSKSKSYMIGDIQKRNEETLFITIFDNFEKIYMFSDKAPSIYIYAPAKNEKDCIEIYKELLKLKNKKVVM